MCFIINGIPLWLFSSGWPSGVCLYMTGVSGAGKTALMAKVADALYRAQLGRAKVLIRFCGTSPDSASGLLLLRSLCRQIHLLLDHAMLDWANILVMDYEAVVEHFHELVRDHALTIFIDRLCGHLLRDSFSL